LPRGSIRIPTTNVAGETKPVRMGTAATTEIEETNQGTIPKRSAGNNETISPGLRQMATAATVIVV